MFGLIDEARRQVGRLLDASGLGPSEAPFRVIAEQQGARLRAYEASGTADGPVLLILPAPFKRPYIWDLLPEVSVVRHCLARGSRVYLLEWTPPSTSEDDLGLADYAGRFVTMAVEAIECDAESREVVLVGHSLGGTFAAIFASLHPGRVHGLVLVDAPLAFGDCGGPLARAVAGMPHVHAIREVAGGPVPGSALDLLCVAAAPDIFQGQRWSDFAASLLAPDAFTIHQRVERWLLDEFPLPGRLFEETLELLYRDDRFALGSLRIGGRRAAIDLLRAPVLAVVNPHGRVVPPRSITAALERVPRLSGRVLVYEGDRGPVLQHLGPLVGPSAHKRLWPEIMNWIDQLG